MEAKTLQNEFVIANPKGKAKVWKSEDFWKMALDKEHLENNPQMGYLISQFSFDTDWDSWEMHPNGDEIVFCTSGQIKFILEIDGQHKIIEIEQGQYIVIPKMIWHTAKVNEPASALFFTWGFGTQNRELKSSRKSDKK